MDLNKPSISVIVPHLNQPAALAACLGSLAAQRVGAGAFEVIVVDNGSAQLPTEVVAQYAHARLLREAQPGPGPARNTGIRHARADVVACIDADCRAHPDWLATALAALRAAPAGTVLGGDVRIWRDSRPGFTAIEAYESVFAYRFKLYIERHGFCGTGNMVMHRETFDAVGPFGGIECAEDMDWGARARAAGYRFRYVPAMIVYHPARRSLAALYAQWDRHTQHFLHMTEGTPHWRLRWALRALAILASPGIDFTKALSSDRIDGASARLKSIAVLTCVRAHRARTMLGLLASRRGIVWNSGAAASEAAPQDSNL